MKKLSCLLLLFILSSLPAKTKSNTFKEYKLELNYEQINPKAYPLITPNKYGIELFYFPKRKEGEILNIKYMNNSYCYGIDSPYLNPKEAEGLTTNLPVDFPLYYKPSTKKLELRVFLTQKSIFKKSYAGFKLLLANPTDKNITIAHEDSRFNIIAQAKDSNGTWRDIEHLPHSTCGNSFGTYQLPAHKTWVFSAPIYNGNIKVKLRYKMGNILSNEFNGTINKEQFSVKWRDPNDPFDWLYGEWSF